MIGSLAHSIVAIHRTHHSVRPARVQDRLAKKHEAVFINTERRDSFHARAGRGNARMGMFPGRRPRPAFAGAAVIDVRRYFTITQAGCSSG